MDASYESKTPSESETSPLLDDQASRFHRQNSQSSSSLTPRKSIFSCAVICILFTELCERLTYYGILGNLVLFITATDQLKLSPQEASTISYVFQGGLYSNQIKWTLFNEGNTKQLFN